MGPLQFGASKLCLISFRFQSMNDRRDVDWHSVNDVAQSTFIRTWPVASSQRTAKLHFSFPEDDFTAEGKYVTVLTKL